MLLGGDVHAVGRVPEIDDLDLEVAGVARTAGGVVVNVLSGLLLQASLESGEHEVKPQLELITHVAVGHQLGDLNQWRDVRANRYRFDHR